MPFPSLGLKNPRFSVLLVALAIAIGLSGTAAPLLAAPSKGGPPADRRARIEGGKRVGTFELGKTWGPYSKILGEPTEIKQSELSDTARMIYFKKYGLYFFVKKDRVNGITVSSPLYTTIEGIRVGSGRPDVLRIYGQPQSLRDGEVVYPERGLGFTFDHGRVSRIYVVDKEARDLVAGDRRIVPGGRVGGIQLGQSVQFVLTHWKNPQQRGAFPSKPGAEMWSYPKRGIIVVVAQGKVEGVWVFSPEYRTGKDVRVGSKRGDVVRAYGKPGGREDNMESYPRAGLGFFYENGVVRQIYVRETQ